MFSEEIKNCTVTVRGSDGSRTKARGSLQREGDCDRLVYLHEGDRVELLFGKNGVAYVRKGSFTVEMNFAEGQNTACLMTEHGLSGKLPVFTRRADVRRGAYGLSVRLEYELGGEEKLLKLTAVTEKKDEN